MQYVILNSYLCCFVSWDEIGIFFLLAFVSVYHSKRATEISLWKPVYGLPPHMFAVSLWRGQAGNERLLLGRETQAFYLPPPPSEILICLSIFTVCFPTIAPLENMMRVRLVEGVEVFWSNSGIFLFGSAKAIRPLPTLVQLGLPLEYFRCWLVAKHLYNNKHSVFFSFFFWSERI